MQALETYKYIIVDFGSQHTKIGFSGEGYPRFILPSVIAYKNPDNPAEEPLVGFNALYSEGLTLVHPFQESTISEHGDWEWRYVKELITALSNPFSLKYLFSVEATLAILKAHNSLSAYNSVIFLFAYNVVQQSHNHLCLSYLSRKHRHERPMLFPIHKPS